jgi:hypothetical protein
VVIYASNVREAPTILDMGSLKYTVENVMMCDYDGNTIYKGLTDKLESGEELSDKDILNIVFIPLMKNDIPVYDLVVKSVEMAQTIKDEERQEMCLTSIFAFSEKYIKDTEMLTKLKGVFRMTTLADMFIDEGLQKGRQDEKYEIARKMLEEGSAIEFVIKITGLNELAIRKLQTEIAG